MVLVRGDDPTTLLDTRRSLTFYLHCLVRSLYLSLLTVPLFTALGLLWMQGTLRNEEEQGRERGRERVEVEAEEEEEEDPARSGAQLALARAHQEPTDADLAAPTHTLSLSLLRWTIDAAGPCWQKAAQWAATRPDLFSTRLCLFLSLLQHSAPTHPFSHTLFTITQAISPKKLEEVFSDVSPSPIASGVVGQVHRGVLCDDARTVVAIKVRHPHVARLIELDMVIMGFLASAVSLLPGTEILALRLCVAQFARSLHAQTDLRVEADNLRRFGANFEGDAFVHFPRVVGPAPREDLLVETFEAGIPLYVYLRETGPLSPADRRLRHRIATTGMNAYLRMVLVHNFIHADLHGGNILVLPPPPPPRGLLAWLPLPKRWPRLVFLDVGLATELSQYDRRNFINLFVAIARGQGELAAELMIRHSRLADSALADGERREQFRVLMGRVFHAAMHQEMSKVSVARVIEDMFRLSRRFSIVLEPNYVSLFSSTALLEGIGRQLDPSLDLLMSALPILSSVAFEQSIRTLMPEEQ
jgi:aarF domain-containing kinase